jgi:acyl-CoA synthetase (AMP-forming)/AMP-acid ligase II
LPIFESSWPVKGSLTTDRLCDRVRCHPRGKLALVDDEQAITYGELIGAADERAREFQSGRPIPLRATSTISFVVDYLAVHLAGATALPYDPQISQSNWEWIEQRLSLPSQYRDVADILLTSGTTGRPKGVVLTHRNILAAAQQINGFIGNSPDDCELLLLPLCHSFGLGRLRSVLLQGGAVVLAPGMARLGRLMDKIEQHRVTGLALVPLGVSLLLKVAEEQLSALSGQLRYLEIGSAPMERRDKEQLCRLLPRTRICMHYGLTEGSRAAFLSFHDSPDRLDSIGRATPGVEMKVSKGHLLVRGEMVMKEYWQDEEATCEKLKEGWLKTGDLGWQDEEGYFYLSGRESEMLNIGGRKISPVEIERVLNQHEAIAESVCCERAGREIHAHLVARGEARPSSVELTSFLRERLEPYKVPALFSWVSQIPKSESGKLQRNRL